MSRARWEVLSNLADKPLVLLDVGPWTKYASITNDAERVVEYNVRAGLLPPGRKLYYYDSAHDPGELLVEDGKFAGFGPVTLDEMADAQEEDPDHPDAERQMAKAEYDSDFGRDR